MSGELEKTHPEELEELAAGYALGALDADDLARLRAHLPECDRCRTLIAEYGSVVVALPAELDEMEASPELRDRILEAAGAKWETTPTERFAAPFARPRAPLWALPLSALLAVALGLGYWNYRLQQQLAIQTAVIEDQQRALAVVAAGGRQWTLAGTDSAPRAGGVLVQAAGDPRPFLFAHDLPDLPPQQMYQAWIIAAGTPQEAGLLPPGQDGTHVVRLDRPLGSADTVAVTIEPAGGSRSPTGRIVLAGKL
ncbi:MAG TPA: anti-sigma factor [Chloroflexota bacterium]|nr:anti-sigma factor [Chloroflexota bacterium]